MTATTKGPDLLARVGAALHGEAWQSPLARDLGVNLRTIQRWANGQNRIDPRMWGELGSLLDGRAEEMRDLIEEIGR